MLMFLLSGCDFYEEGIALKENVDEKKIWAFFQFNVPEEGRKIESYYYYAQISKCLFDRISKNEIKKGFILLQTVKYFGNDNLIHEYRDSENQGDILFRIEDIRRLILVRKEPKAGLGLEQFDEPKKSAQDEIKKDPVVETAKE